LVLLPLLLLLLPLLLLQLLLLLPHFGDPKCGEGLRLLQLRDITRGSNTGKWRHRNLLLLEAHNLLRARSLPALHLVHVRRGVVLRHRCLVPVCCCIIIPTTAAYFPTSSVLSSPSPFSSASSFAIAQRTRVAAAFDTAAARCRYLLQQPGDGVSITAEHPPQHICRLAPLERAPHEVAGPRGTVAGHVTNVCVIGSRVVAKVEERS
jgi:hypothetical protein